MINIRSRVEDFLNQGGTTLQKLLPYLETYHLIIGPSQFTQLSLHFPGVPPYVNLVSQAICIYFSSWCTCVRERGRGKGWKNTSGKMCKVFVPSAGMLAGPIKFEHSK